MHKSHLNRITAEAVTAAVELLAWRAGGGGGNPAFTVQNIEAVAHLLYPDNGAPIAVTTNFINAVLPLTRQNIDINQDNVGAADEIIRNAGGAGQVNANNVAAADALLRTAVAAPLAVNANNVAVADALLTARLPAAALTNPQLLAVTGATGVNANTGDAVVWAIANGFGGQPAGTVPAGIIQRQGPPVGHPGDVLLRVTWLNAAHIVVGNLVGAPVANINAGDDITVHTATLGGGNIAGGTRVVFTGIEQDHNAGAAAKRVPVNMALVP